VNVTLVPEQIVVAVADIETLAGRFGLTVIVMPADVAGDPVKHGLAFEVS
jgi:prophage tail gpP-like protein